MRAIIKQGENQLFLSGWAGKNLQDIKDIIILNFNERYVYDGFKFYKKINTLIVRHTEDEEDLVITFSGPVEDITFSTYCKDQLILNVKH